MTKKALISVSDKTGIVEFAKELKALGWDIISTGGTKVALDYVGVERLDTAIHHLWKTSHIIDGNGLHPSIIKGNLGPTG